ncbi:MULTISPECIES: hypothetical protein [unclassified Bradyrhizobium]|uniref:hypothetical protein n=1 Tax=unclassified Bradyrhizobium TaxID=2631580 RepID=UPI0024E1051C|nr:MULTISPECIES: hypothetical protein [unclassified Bradyrhizobium]
MRLYVTNTFTGVENIGAAAEEQGSLTIENWALYIVSVAKRQFIDRAQLPQLNR